VFLPWTEIPRRSSMRPDEFLDWLRAAAIGFGTPQTFIDSIDELYGYSTQDERIEELEENLETTEEQRDDLKRVLKNLLADRENDKAANEAQDVLDEI
jgi:hypothetical protein